MMGDLISLLQRLVLAADSRPWLWSVYVFSVGLPLVLFVSFMWPDKRFGPPDQPYYYKKSDEVQEDDAEMSRFTEAAAAQDDAPTSGARKRIMIQKKRDLELSATPLTSL